MKSTAPWSVKGIEREAREKAKDAARREGMTLGEWLNRVIEIAGDGETGLSGISPDTAMDAPRVRDLAEVVGRLSDHIARAETDSAGQMEDVARKVGGVLERVQRLEQGGNRNQQIEQALIRLAEADQARTRSIKALETAVTHIATQFNKAQKQASDRFGAVDQRFEDVIARLDAAGGLGAEGASALAGEIESMRARIDLAESLAGEAANQRPAHAPAEFVDSVETRFRILGDEIKRTGDRTRSIEKSIGDLAAKIEDAERRSAVAVERLAETISVLREDLIGKGGGERAAFEKHISALAHTTEQRIGALHASFLDLAAKIDDRSGESYGRRREDDEAEHDHSTDQLSGAQVEDYDEFADPFSDEALQADDDDADDGFDDGYEAPAPAASAPGHSAGRSAGRREAVEADDDGEGTDESATAEKDGSLGDADDDAGEAQSDLDDIMAELDALGFGSSGAQGDGDDFEEEDAAPRRAINAPAKNVDPLDELADDDTDDDDTDDVRSDRREDEMFARRTTEPQQEPQGRAQAAEGKRRLTPRQRAILQAKIRRKRLAEARARNGGAEDGSSEQPAAANSPTRPAQARARSGEAALNGEAARKSGPVAEPRDAAARRGAATARGKPEPRDGGETAAAASVFDRVKEALGIGSGAPAADADAKGAGRRRASLTSKPVTAALGAGVVLTGATFAFLLRDGAIAPQRNASLQLPGPGASQDRGAAAVETARTAGSAIDASYVEPPTTDPRELFVLGIERFAAADSAGDKAESIELIRQAATLGHPPAQLQYGEMMKLGQDVPRDLEGARGWYRRAATGGNVLAMHRLGVMAARGEGGVVDVTESLSWFEKAANYGLVNSMYNLGATFHPTGEERGAAYQDAGKAYFWYSVAARNGDDQAANLAKGVGDTLSPDALAELDEQIAAWSAIPRDDNANEKFGA